MSGGGSGIGNTVNLGFGAHWPPTSREDVMTALFALLQTLQTSQIVVTCDRRLKLWFEISSEEKPAVYMVEHEEDNQPSPSGMSPKRQWQVMIFIYADAPQDGVTKGSILLNNLIDQVEAALGLQGGAISMQNLGGRVYRVWSEGRVLKDPGDLDGHALAIYPVHIRAP
jgi:hypothetical protein